MPNCEIPLRALILLAVLENVRHRICVRPSSEKGELMKKININKQASPVAASAVTNQ